MIAGQKYPLPGEPLFRERGRAFLVKASVTPEFVGEESTGGGAKTASYGREAPSA